ncbi:MAG TPA: MBL fold metallo-hydrolase [Bacteroidales bacterium]|nr:MBL fold metallo-hydrolase [Bacteroidales bacterium]
MKIKFIGATREVTGSKFLITAAGKKILLDCGMFQGKGLETDSMNRDLMFDPSTIDHVILTHAHIDHSGLIPYLYHLGFRGSVICTSATRDLCAIMLSDSAFIQEHDTRTFNKRRAKKGLPLVTPIYTTEDATACMALFIGIPYGMKFRIDDNIKVRFTNTGHMLGSGVANLEIKENNHVTKIAYTGDIGRPYDEILCPPVPFPQADILLTESTYGDRLHPNNEEAKNALLDILVNTCVNKGGKLLIPAFSVGRTQEIVFALNNFFNEGKLPKIDIFVDSPLSVNATEVFRVHPECYNEVFLNIMKSDPDPFGFGNLFYIKRVEDSKRLNDHRKPCVIISSSGMMEAGRIKHHLANNISDPANTVLIVGYCAPATLGARIARGESEVSIHGVVHKVKAEIKKIESFSGHGDYREMAEFLSCQNKSSLKKVFIVHGEYETQKKYAGYLETNGFRNIEIPAKGQEIEI